MGLTRSFYERLIPTGFSRWRQPDCEGLNQIHPTVGAYRIRPITKWFSSLGRMRYAPTGHTPRIAGFPHNVNSDFHAHYAQWR